jgi:hypothetical protein
VDVSFLSAIKAVELLFSPVDPVVVDFPLTLWVIVVCVFVFFCFLSFGSGMKAQLKKPILGEWLAFRVVVEVLWLIFYSEF